MSIRVERVWVCGCGSRAVLLQLGAVLWRVCSGCQGQASAPARLEDLPWLDTDRALQEALRELEASQGSARTA